MPRFLAKPGAVLHSAIALIALCSLIGVAVISLPSPSPSAPMTSQPPSGPTGREIKQLLIELGLGPSELAAAGVSPAQTAALVQAAREHLARPGAPLGGLRRDHATTLRELRAAQRAGSTGTTGENQAGQVAALTATLAQRRAALDSGLAAALVAVGAGLTDTQRTTLTALRSSSDTDLPVEFRATQRGEDRRVALRDALIQDRIDRQRGTPGQAAALLDTARSEPAVASARANLTESLDAVTAAWRSAAGE